MRVIIGPTLPGCASPPGCGASSKVRVWLLVGIDLIVKPLGLPAVVRRAGGQKKPHPRTAPSQSAFIWRGCPPCSQPQFVDKEPKEQRISLTFGAKGVQPSPTLQENDFEMFLRPHSGNYSELKIKWSWESLHAVCYRHIVV